MPTQFLKTHYRRGASVLTPEQVEEIRCLKNKVPAYMIVRDYHINKNRVSDIWDNCERLQQDGEYVLADMLPKASNLGETVHFKNNPLGPPNVSSENYSECDVISDSKKKKTGGRKLRFKSVRISEPSVIQTQPIPASSESLDIKQEDVDIHYEKAVKRSEKNLAKKLVNVEHNFENNSPIP